MATIELATFLALAVFTVAVSWRLVRRHRRMELDVGRDPRSGSLASAAASTLLCLKLDRLVGAGSVLYLPVGDGRYPLRTTPAKARAWRRTLVEWLDRGATIHVISTIPNRTSKELWEQLGRNHRDFYYHELDRDRADPKVAREVARLDTYHPIVLVNRSGPGKPGAMWIERYHPIDSATAYGVQYVAPADIRADTRFEVFLSVYDLLLSDQASRPQEAEQRKVA
jgi:hypothetical protein